MKEELKSIFKYLLDFAKHPEQYNDDMVALLKVEQVIELLNYIDILNNQLQQKENIINKLENYIRARADDNDTCSVCSVMTDELLNILEGSDKE